MFVQEDADTFASWGVDYVKLDGCYSHPNDMDAGYPEFGYWLNQVVQFTTVCMYIART